MERESWNRTREWKVSGRVGVCGLVAGHLAGMLEALGLMLEVKKR
jgi:hypothetical protein